jgi:hypothetical protein
MRRPEYALHAISRRDIDSYNSHLRYISKDVLAVAEVLSRLQVRVIEILCKVGCLSLPQSGETIA